MSRPVTITESNNTVEIREDAPVVTPEPWYQGLATVPTSQGSATVTADATPHTKGAWTEVIASNAAETSALLFTLTGVSQNSINTATLIDVGIGASGSETAIVENIAVSGAADVVFVLPYQVASGARIAVRSQAIIGGDTVDVEIDTLALGNAAGVGTPAFDVLGTSTATSAGTRLSSTVYTEIVASTSQDYKAVVLVDSNTNTVGGANYDIELATGLPTAEITIARKPTATTTGEAAVTDTYFGSITAVSITAGTRLSAIAANATNATRIGDVTVIGIPAT